LLFRLSFLDKKGNSFEIAKKQFAVIESISRLTGESVNNIDTVFGLYTGGERIAGLEPICTKNPSCGNCQITNYCSFFRYRDESKQIKKYPIKEWAEEDRPREKLEQIGAGRLSETELLAIFIRTGVGNESALDVAKKLL